MAKFNDAKHTTYAHVLELFDRAIKTIETRERAGVRRLVNAPWERGLVARPRHETKVGGDIDRRYQWDEFTVKNRMAAIGCTYEEVVAWCQKRAAQIAEDNGSDGRAE